MQAKGQSWRHARCDCTAGALSRPTEAPSQEALPGRSQASPDPARMFAAGKGPVTTTHMAAGALSGQTGAPSQKVLPGRSQGPPAPAPSGSKGGLRIKLHGKGQEESNLQPPGTLAHAVVSCRRGAEHCTLFGERHERSQLQLPGAIGEDQGC